MANNIFIEPFWSLANIYKANKLSSQKLLVSPVMCKIAWAPICLNIFPDLFQLSKVNQVNPVFQTSLVRKTHFKQLGSSKKKSDNATQSVVYLCIVRYKHL